MPHTSRRKRLQRSKRVEVTDENGWTRITSNSCPRRAPNLMPTGVEIEKYLEATEFNQSHGQPADMPEGRTLEDIKEQYRKIEKRWLESQSYKELANCLEEHVSLAVLRQIDTCLVFGTGSFCGYVQGWIARHDVALFQLAAFISVVNSIERMRGSRPRAYAQEPRYNQYDIDLLSGLDIGTHTTPAGFEAVGKTSFTYLPNAELDVTLRALCNDPAIALVSGGVDGFWCNEKGEVCTDRIMHRLVEKEEEGRSIKPDAKSVTEAGAIICSRFRDDKDVRKLPALDAKDEPFHDERLYFKRRSEEDNI